MLYTHRLAFKNYANIMNHKNKPKFAFRLHSVIYNYCWIVLRKFTIKLKCKSLSSINHFTVRQYFWSMKDKCSHYCHKYMMCFNNIHFWRILTKKEQIDIKTPWRDYSLTVGSIRWFYLIFYGTGQKSVGFSRRSEILFFFITPLYQFVIIQKLTTGDENNLSGCWHD